MPEYNEELWDEIPTFAFIALGRRGREQVSLRECYIPKCGSTVSEKLHPISMSESVKKSKEGDAEIETKKFLIHCDACNANFQFVFDSHKMGEDTVNVRVYATNEDGTENYGEIGWVQPKFIRR
jgi:hypothetical protein